MIKVYLDWNVMSQLKNKNIEPGLSLFVKLKECENKLELPYSPAHISDLIKGWDDTVEKDTYTRNDLKHISEITKNLFYVLYFKATGVINEYKDPEHYFDSVKDEEKKSIPKMLDFETMFKEAEFDEESLKNINAEMDKVMAGMRASMSTVDLSSLSGTSELKQFLSLVPTEGQTFTEYMKEAGGYFEGIMKDPDIYRGLRNTVQSGLGLDPKVISNWQNPYKQLDEHLPNTLLGKSLTQFISENNKTKTTENVLYENFCMVYPTFDMFGFRPEDLSSKNTYENMSNDCQHAFYAAHCKFFLTNDKKTIAKTIATYKHFGILTEVCTPDEFIKRIDLSKGV
ncbi:MAG: hypothetical protein H0U95_14475 [Bacteroidetes bacterium]|nr:hypothetical protein [Bacteroidota bacterium]